MRNLQLLYNRQRPTQLADVKLVVVDADRPHKSYICTSTQQYCIDWETEGVSEVAAVSDVIACEHLALNNELCLATANGEVNIVYLESHNGLETVTFCEGGIAAMAWSPDQEIVVFVTIANSLVVMNSAYDPLNEHNLDSDAFGEEEFVNVGWGKKETQFHGTEGKLAAKQKSEEIVVDDVAKLDTTVSVRWRGDGEYFAVSFIGKWGRMFKVYDKEGKLKYTSEKCAGLEAPIFWRPSGNWIAIPQVLPNKYTIALFEKNGLRHREIVLPFKASEEQVVNLLWSSDSDVLAIETVRDGKSNVHLFTVCNYHWYLKQTLAFADRLRTIVWHSGYSEGKSLHVVQNDGTYSIYRWDFIVNHSTGNTTSDQAIVAVIDNANVLLTNFRGAVVPPPMSSAVYKNSTSINHVGFIRHPNAASDGNQFFVVDAAGHFTTVDCEFEVNTERNINLLVTANPVSTYSLELNNDVPLFNRQYLWLTDNQIVFCNTNDVESTLHLAKLSKENKSVKAVDLIVLPGCIGNLTDASNNTVVFQLTNGEVYSITIDGDQFQPPDHLYTLNTLCERLETTTTGTGGPIKIVSLKNQQNLYVNDKKLATEVSSFHVTENYILFTTLDQLKFVRLDNDQIINERRIERGSKLVTVVPKDSRAIMQMPRGNLETIQPRVLSLCIVAQLLDALEYHKTFDLLRKQRINLNLLVDHDPVKFLANIDHFVVDIQNTQWLNLFLSDLLDDDVTLTMYSSNYQKRTNEQTEECFHGRKIEVICERICDVFLAKGLWTYLLPVVTTYVKRQKLEEALRVIWEVKQTESIAATGSTPAPADCPAAVTSQEALKYLLYLVNVNELYNVALGMYDFNLVLFVAQKSQKDPKEYIPFLNELKNFEENYRKYKIDQHLKRFDRALEHIVHCGVEKLDECLELIATHGLHTKALRLFKKDHECYSDVVAQFADHLRAKGQIYDACVMYERAGDFKQALLSAKHILEWRKCAELAAKLDHTKAEIKQLCLSLIPALQENNKFRDAAEIVRTYQNDSMQVIKYFCDGKHYEEAIYEARNSKEFIEQIIKPHLSSTAAQQIIKFAADTVQFNSYTKRLQTIRIEKANKLAGGVEDDDDCDMFSDTSSMNSSRLTGSSRGSGKSTRSSKNRRKNERKLLSLKEGNPFEDIALVDALYNLTHRSFEQQSQVHELLKVLIDLELDVDGVQLQQTYADLLTTIRDSLNTIWIPEMMVSGEVKSDEIMEYVRAQDEQHYAMIKTHQRCRPLLNTIDWQFEVLK